MEAVEIAIINWKKYQGEKAAKHESTGWYRQQNNIWEHEIWDVLTGDEYKAKAFIDCMVSQRAHKTGRLFLVIATAARRSGLPADVIVSTIKKLGSRRIGYLQYQEIEVKHLDSPLDPPTDPQDDPEDTSTAPEGDPKETLKPLQGDLPAEAEETRSDPKEPLRNVTIRNDTNERNDVAAPESPPTVNPVWSTWVAYSIAYEKRHGAPPPKNDKNMAHCAQMVKRLGADSAPLVLQFYLTHPDRQYVAARHPLILAVRDAEKLHTDWKTGKKQTTGAAQQEESRAGNADAARAYYERKHGIPEAVQ